VKIKGVARPRTQETSGGDCGIPTNVPGVFTSPAPPEDFDPRTATAASLVQHGLLWPRPGKVDDPRVVAFWEKVFSRRWLDKT
jgi:hypothetical protein